MNFKHFSALLVVFALFFASAPFVDAYGGGGGAPRNRCIDPIIFSSIFPHRDTTISSLDKVSFVAKNVSETSPEIKVNGIEITTTVKTLEDGSFLVEGILSDPITEHGLVGIDLYAKSSSRCYRNSIYYVTIGEENDINNVSVSKKSKSNEVEKVVEEKGDTKKNAYVIEKVNACDELTVFDGGNKTFSFKDISGHWAENDIKKLASACVIQGTKNGEAKAFEPNKFASRAQVTKIAIRSFVGNIPKSISSKPFNDVEATDWYAVYVHKAKSVGVIKSAPNFYPDESVSRVAALAILIRSKGIDTSGADLSVLESFQDIDLNDPKQFWFHKNVAWAVENGIMNGYSNKDGSSKGIFGPGDGVTNAQVAAMVSRFIK